MYKDVMMYVYGETHENFTETLSGDDYTEAQRPRSTWLADHQAAHPCPPTFFDDSWKEGVQQYVEPGQLKYVSDETCDTET